MDTTDTLSRRERLEEKGRTTHVEEDGRSLSRKALTRAVDVLTDWREP